VSPSPPGRYRITLAEIHRDGTTRQLVEGICSAYILAITDDGHGELRVLTDHDGPADQRRRALESLTAHIRSTIGLGR
jgi:hypothetical protein